MGVCEPVSRPDYAPWIDMQMLHCNKERGYIVRVGEKVAQYVHVSSSNFPVERIYFVAFDNLFDWLLVYDDFDHWLKKYLRMSATHS